MLRRHPLHTTAHYFSQFLCALPLVRLRMMRLQTMQFLLLLLYPPTTPFPDNAMSLGALEKCPDVDLTRASVKLLLLSNH